MITEISFVRDYTSFWRATSPLSESFIRRINLSVLERFDEEIRFTPINSRRAFLNEAAFEIFSWHQQRSAKVGAISIDELDDLLKRVSVYIGQMRTGGPLFNVQLMANERNDVFDIAERLLEFFKGFQKVILKPSFQGYGRLDSCIGDVLADNTLYEIKAGSRGFRSPDLRQLVLYFALNHASSQYCISNLALLNPRKGFHFTMPTGNFAEHFSGMSAPELCHRILYELGNPDDTRFLYSV